MKILLTIGNFPLEANTGQSLQPMSTQHYPTPLTADHCNSLVDDSLQSSQTGYAQNALLRTAMFRHTYQRQLKKKSADSGSEIIELTVILARLYYAV